MYHLIGDIHGHATELEALLRKLGYHDADGYFRHPTHTVIFVGDYIDRGPEIPRTLKTVKAMVDNGSAVALMGNHEFNAICFNEVLGDGGYLRPHLIKNFKQHAETLLQFQNRQQEYDDYIEWFKQLPLFYESQDFRAVHASWHTASINHLRDVLDDGRLTDEVLKEIEHPNSLTLDAIEKVLKGLELPLPSGSHFHDKDGQVRHHIRYKWWLSPAGRSFDELSILPDLGLAALPYPADWSTDYYESQERPVFCGHYWLRGQPVLQTANVCCLDYSVAKQGKLVSYRYEGELALTGGRLVW
jgi:diadenosine tetraphosphatase ApaH/serine/threonine PP2A family protein phosphatase